MPSHSEKDGTPLISARLPGKEVTKVFNLLIVQPIFNLLVLIYGLLPFHNFGLSIIIFTIVVRILMWPVVKKQLHHAKAMRALQPELKRIKKAAAGNKQQESVMLMELYKERGISPFGTLGILIVQLIILTGLYFGLKKVVVDPHAILTFSYPVLHNLPWLKTLSGDIGRFDATLLGFIDLKRAAINHGGGFYYPALALVLGSAAAQFFQSKQLLPQSKDSRSLRTILKEAGDGKQSDQGEVNAAIGQSTKWFLPIFLIVFTAPLASALSLYWLTSGIVAYLQQAKVLGKDEAEMEDLADEPGKKKFIEGEVIEKPKATSKTAAKKKQNKRRKR